MQARSNEGPIAKAGPGYHHVAVYAKDIKPVLRNLRGWHVLPSSFRSLDKGGPAWLGRRDLGLLVELCPGEAPPRPGLPTMFRYVTAGVSDTARARELIANLGIDNFLVTVGDNRITQVDLQIGTKRASLGPGGSIAFPSF